MIDGALVGKASVETLSLFHTLLKMAEAAEKDGNSPSLEQLIAELQPTALKLANAFVQELHDLRTDFTAAFKSSPKDLDKTLIDLQSETGWWRLKRYKLLRNFAPTVEAKKTSVGLMLSDFAALANCKEKDALVAAAYAMSSQVRSQLSARADVTQLSVKKILDNLIEDAEKVRNELAEMGKRKL